MTKSQLNFISMTLICLAALLLQPELESRLYGKRISIPQRIEVKTDRAETEQEPIVELPKVKQEVASPTGGGVKETSSSVTIKGELSLSSINQMDARALESINGIGPVLAERIVAYRTTHGAFKSIKELGNVKGIGEKKLKLIEEQLSKEE